MANRRRGEVEALVDGRPVVLCLTLGALCELETAFGVDDLAALAARFASGRLSARDILRVLACGLRGGGTAISDAEVAALPIDGGLLGAAAVVGELLAATFGRDPQPADPPIDRGEGGAVPPAVSGGPAPSPGTI
ncbi:gene transfer agent family protein [Siculibacillus lacustris]|uniref:Gene transfer agent family protein n=1 Tax=Siculibacillus lacustris TaxID=1549641 RepID=A0A4Q9VX72_9HYPH|nr:gene transfer agent family protein [Siculibacillus lacustris]TBW40987.1 gene transfer agent family protein [Siculibacillus lacustris]